jgi:hypothetical protein
MHKYVILYGHLERRVEKVYSRPLRYICPFAMGLGFQQISQYIVQEKNLL